MKVVAFLQNQWFKNPAAARSTYEKWTRSRPRHELNAYFLFAGCKTGRILRNAFGNLCNDIIWEEASPKIGGQSGASFKPDPKHIANVIREHKPDVILTFGKPAREGLAQSAHGCDLPSHVYRLCHPAARGAGALDELKRFFPTLQSLITEADTRLIGGDRGQARATGSEGGAGTKRPTVRRAHPSDTPPIPAKLQATSQEQSA